ncbi:hypothetical protein K491DRAFT_714220 [Lophiostoma macrostomum CBS 122681]|uniref:Uncharacterized protein n=1 Tax=Lophiostoma macrostomum CBS 122681 TaxID=1314788 RepID=A0A6A6TES6_9PLEO|nr:hypothetical protein K491DRAFT_714220 [Lophiostoma macrostomum CBS 122681]
MKLTKLFTPLLAPLTLTLAHPNALAADTTDASVTDDFVRPCTYPCGSSWCHCDYNTLNAKCTPTGCASEVGKDCNDCSRYMIACDIAKLDDCKGHLCTEGPNQCYNGFCKHSTWCF